MSEPPLFQDGEETAGASIRFLPERKRQIMAAFLRSLDPDNLGSSFDNNAQSPLPPTTWSSTPPSTLTESNLKSLEALTEPSTMEQSTASNRSSQTSKQSKTRRTITYADPLFELQLLQRGVEMDITYPQDLEALNIALENPRTLPIINYERLSELASQAGNEASFAWAIVSKLVDFDNLLLDDKLTTIANAQWRDDYPLPETQTSNYRIPAPCPDVTIGYRATSIECNLAMESLTGYLLPVVCQPMLVLPFFTVEAKGIASNHHGKLQNKNNSAVMLRNIRHLHSLVRDEEFLTENFDHNPTVLSATVTKDLIQISCHWTSLDLDTQNTKYHTLSMKSWAIDRSTPWKEVMQYFQNAIEFAANRNRGHVTESLETLKNRIQMPPPPSGFTHERSAKRPRVD